MLNDKQIQFCENYLLMHNIGAAYMAAYPNSAANSACANGSRLLDKKEIQDYIKTRQKESADANLITKNDVITKLLDIIYNDKKARNSDIIKALEILNRMSGFNEPERIEQSGSITNNVIKVRYKGDDDNLII